MDKNWIKSLPKIDLHCHLDGSIGVDVVRKLLSSNELPAKDECLKNALQMKYGSLTEYLKKFELPIRCLQTENGLKTAMINLLKNAAEENIKYLEVRFAPMFSVNDQLDCRKVIESVLDGLKEGKKEFNIHASVIVCAMRQHSVEKNIKMLAIAREYLNSGICALDLAGDESIYPTREQRELFNLAKAWDIPFTIHSGECGSIENVKEAIELGARRLGHGIALRKNDDLIKICRYKKIGIEMCPTSNFQTKAVDSWSTYPLQSFLEQKLLVTINTDNRTVSNTSMTEELMLTYENINKSKEIVIKLLQNAVEISFAEDNIKEELLRELKKAI